MRDSICNLGYIALPLPAISSLGALVIIPASALCLPLNTYSAHTTFAYPCRAVWWVPGCIYAEYAALYCKALLLSKHDALGPVCCLRLFCRMGYG